MKAVVAAAAAAWSDGSGGGGGGGCGEGTTTDAAAKRDAPHPTRRRPRGDRRGSAEGKDKEEPASLVEGRQRVQTAEVGKEREVTGMVLTDPQHGPSGSEGLDHNATNSGRTCSREQLLRRHSAPDCVRELLCCEDASRSRSSTSGGATVERAMEEVHMLPMAAWPCSLCTFLNEPLDPHCMMCGTLRETKEGGLVIGSTTSAGRRTTNKPSKEAAAENGETVNAEQLQGQEEMEELKAELEAMRAKNEKLLTLMMKMKDDANKAKEEKERYTSYETLMTALATETITDDQLETAEAELDTRLALIRQVRRDRARARLLALEREQREMRSTTLCIICTDAPRAVTFAPCGHFITCIECGDTPETCPVCRKWISFRLKTYKN